MRLLWTFYSPVILLKSRMTIFSEAIEK